MIMTETEIRTSYRDARRKAEQITILSQLNDCPQRTIKLIVMGVKPKRKAYKESYPEYARLYAQGMNDHEIERATGMSRGSVRNWRINQGLKALTKKGGYRRVFI